MSKEQAKESKAVEQKPVPKVEPKVEAKKEPKVEVKKEAKEHQGKAETKALTPSKATKSTSAKVVKNSNNAMRELQLDKVVLHMCVGDNAGKLQNAKEILVRLTEMKPVETKAKTRLPKWGIKPGLPIGTKVTLRGKKAKEILARVFKAYKNQIKSKSFDENGNFALGVKEYIDIQGMKYDPKLGLLGFDVIVNLKRRGYRVKNRLLYRKSIGNTHKVTKEDAVAYVNKTFGVDVI
ncbi:MAG: 50S ribosomal protein L5 [Candidatus ainarchaeum sp.]|nr:50S ribosomal protein L5 [Candidatus ainarchaeum sp.]